MGGVVSEAAFRGGATDSFPVCGRFACSRTAPPDAASGLWRGHSGCPTGQFYGSGSVPGRRKHLLHFEERSEAVGGAFVIREGGRVDNLRILLLDDVMTSGAMLDAGSRAFGEAGAKSVTGLTIARAVRQGNPGQRKFLA
jgi:hypothetical protein